jgi:hypothetical protein
MLLAEVIADAPYMPFIQNIQYPIQLEPASNSGMLRRLGLYQPLL